MSKDYERIWLEPPPGDPTLGRLWCPDDVWTGEPDYNGVPATEYIRADLVAFTKAEVNEQVKKQQARLDAWINSALECSGLADVPNHGDKEE